MPYQWVKPEVFMQHNGVTVYHVYKNDHWEDGVRDCWYALCEDDESIFDYRDLPGIPDSELAKYEKLFEGNGAQQVIAHAIDVGYFDGWDKDEVLPDAGENSRSHWDIPEYPVEDWRREVNNDDTRLGYLEWVDHQMKMRGAE